MEGKGAGELSWLLAEVAPTHWKVCVSLASMVHAVANA